MIALGGAPPPRPDRSRSAPLVEPHLLPRERRLDLPLPAQASLRALLHLPGVRRVEERLLVVLREPPLVARVPPPHLAVALARGPHEPAPQKPGVDPPLERSRARARRALVRLARERGGVRGGVGFFRFRGGVGGAGGVVGFGGGLRPGSVALRLLLEVLQRLARLDAVLFELLRLHRGDARELPLGASEEAAAALGFRRELGGELEIAPLAAVVHPVAALHRARGEDGVAVVVHRARGEVTRRVVVVVAVVRARARARARALRVVLGQVRRAREFIGGAREVALPPLLLPLVPQRVLRAEALLVLALLHLDGLRHTLAVLAQTVPLLPPHLAQHRLPVPAVRLVLRLRVETRNLHGQLEEREGREGAGGAEGEGRDRRRERCSRPGASVRARARRTSRPPERESEWDVSEPPTQKRAPPHARVCGTRKYTHRWLRRRRGG